MQPDSPDYSQVNRRPMDVEDYLDVLRRHKSWIIGPAFAGLVIAFVVAFFWPDTYVSEAVIRVIPAQISDKLVMPVNPAGMTQRVNSTAQTVLSRQKLTDLITSLNLYPSERKRQPLEDIIEQMRHKDISMGQVTAVSSPNSNSGSQPVAAFRLSFRYENRQLAQKVVEELKSQFINESTKNIGNENRQTTEFFDDQLNNARRHLDEVEAQLTTYQKRYNGQLPEQQQMIQSQVQMLQSQVESANAQLNRATQNRLILESQLQSAQSHRNSLKPPVEETPTTARNEELQFKDRQIQAAETDLAALRERYRDTHPDVQRQAGIITALRKSRESLVKAQPASAPETSPMFLRLQKEHEREVRDYDSDIQRIQGLLRANVAEADSATRMMDRLNNELKEAQGRLELVPAGAQQYGDLLREQRLAKDSYEELKRKKDAAALSYRATQNVQGEHLEQLDPPSLPVTPVEPKRPVIVGAGLGLGLLIGLCLAGVREAKDTSLKNLKDVRAYTQLNVLGSIPLLENDLIVRRRRRVAVLAWTAACLVGFVAMTGSVIYYYYSVRV